jgi:hypothetical protein
MVSRTLAARTGIGKNHEIDPRGACSASIACEMT